MNPISKCGSIWRPLVGLALALAASIAGAVTVSPASLPPIVAGAPYSATLIPADGLAPYHVALAGGRLPTGLTLSGNTLSGVPAAEPYSFTIGVGDSLGNDLLLTAVSLNYASADPLSIAPAGTVGPYSATLLSGALPTGMSVLSNGTLGGQATTAGTYTATFRITDGNGVSAMVTVSLAVVLPPTPIPALSPLALLLLSWGLLLAARRRLPVR